jgi:hypothetical protein
VAPERAAPARGGVKAARYLEVRIQSFRLNEVRHNRCVDFEKVFAQLQETLTVMANIQARHAQVLKEHCEWQEQNEAFFTRMREGQQLHEQRLATHDLRMVEIDEKLSAMIQVVDGPIKRNGKPGN